ncbi:MAG TPA: hypothetical protein VKQ06_00140 [Gammaproteobacteria bacterium]|nr:hypothetical protein [Gammaproteobacteria bacterium]
MNVNSKSGQRIIERGRVYAAVAAACLAAPAIHAQPVGVGTNAEEVTEIGIAFGAGRSDNVLRQGANESAGTYASLGAQMDIVRTRPRFNVAVAGDIEYRDYTTDGFDAERVGIIDASLEALAVPDRFSWYVGGRGGQGRTDPFGVESPENRENIDIYETGPRVTLPFGQRTSAELSATAGRRYFEVSSSLDSATTDVEAGLYRVLSPTSQLGLVVSTRSTEYDLSIYDNDVERAYLAYTKEFATGSAALSVGSNRVDNGTSVETGPYLFAQWQRRVGARSVFTTTLMNQYVDAADNIDYERLIVFGGDPGGLDSSVLLSQDVYESTDLLTSLTINGTRTTVTFGASLGEARYMTDFALDNDVINLSAVVERDMSSRMALGFEFDYAHRDFVLGPQEDDDKFIRLWLQREFSGPFSGRLGFGHNARSGNETADYDENVWTLGFQYDIRSSGGA